MIIVKSINFTYQSITLLDLFILVHQYAHQH
jgi:hypothetical protein